MSRICNYIQELKPALMMVVVQVAFAGVNVFYKLAANQGMSLSVIVAYRYIFAAGFMIPLALILERKRRPKMNMKTLFQGFICGLFGGSLSQYLYLESLALTSATFASAMTNLIPAMTFILAISFRLERLDIRRRGGKAKVFGTLMGIGGAMLLTFYKGMAINVWSTNVNLLHHSTGHLTSLHPEPNKRLIGCLLGVASCFSYALWLIVQAKMSEQYPCQYSSTALMCFMGAIQAVVFALFKEKDWSQWKLSCDIKLLTVAYSGIVVSGLMVTLLSWCVRIRGPLFASTFNPLMLVVVAFVGSLVLDEKPHLGSILGATLIVCGLYAVLWGKGEEKKQITQLMPSKGDGELDSIDIVITSPTVQTCNTNHDNVSNTINDEAISSKENEGKDENDRGRINKVNGGILARENGEKEENNPEDEGIW